MIEPCQYCASERVAAVLDKRMEKSPTAGNKYRKRCLSCGRWLPMCSAADYQTAEHQHILPADADPDDDDPTVQAAEFNGADTASADAGDQDDPPEVRADGGEVVDDDDEEPDVNRFACPECGNPVEGYPDECPHPGCGVPYNWPDETTE